MDQTDETVTNDGELLDWFSTRPWWDLSIAMSMAMLASVEFPDREGCSDHDPIDHFTLLVYETQSALEYPLTIRQSLTRALHGFD